MSAPFVIRGNCVVRDGSTQSAAIHVRDGVIAAVTAYEDVPPGMPVIDAGDSCVMAGLVDTHVHLNDPGRSEWEGFSTGTRSAAAGGVTTVVDMPLNSVPATTTMEGFHGKLAAAAGKCWVDAGFWGGVVPGNTHEIASLARAGVLGFKCFLVPSGVAEFEHVTEADLRAALPALRECGMVLLAHAESPEHILPGPASGGSRYATYLATRPRAAENEAIAMLIRLCREFRTRIHVVHLSSSDAVPMLRDARAEGLPITVETCPHYLCFTAEEIPDGATQFKCAPPIRESENRDRLWDALADGVIDLIATDHSPCPPAMKRRDTGDFLAAWGGIASLQLGLAAVWTEARRRGFGVESIARWMAEAPARLAGLGDRKGSLAKGRDADIVIWDPRERLPNPYRLQHRHKLTPYDPRLLSGTVERTILRGQTVFHRGEVAPAPLGQVLVAHALSVPCPHSCGHPPGIEGVS